MFTSHKIVLLAFSAVQLYTASAQKLSTDNLLALDSTNHSKTNLCKTLRNNSPPTKTIVAFRTNLLYDALTLLNIGIEYPFYKDRFSIVYDHQFPWWRGGDFRNKFCLRYLQMCGELRWWFLPKPIEKNEKHKQRDRLIGHFIGPYMMGGKYDFQRKRDICYQGEFWSAGFTYGYVMPLGKSRLNMEFSISLGYASIQYRHFFPAEDYSKLFLDPDNIGKWKYLGITKVGITLTYPLTVSNKKGGKR